MRTSLTLAGGVAALLLVSACLPSEESRSQVATPDRAAQGANAPAPVQEAPDARPDLLQAAPGGDGDSWRDTTGREYRLGMVDAPEVGRCFAAEATAERVRRVAAGFRADVYSVDRYGRSVSVVTTADGVNLNVDLARRGFVGDRYLSQFRHENPSLAAELDAAFAAAKAERAGLWGACGESVQGLAAPVAAPAAEPGGDCHPDYATCIPVKGDGSGRGDANDLDCGQIRQAVQLRQRGVDPYRLDGDGDGVGCDR